jgi:hypothetical protein
MLRTVTSLEHYLPPAWTGSWTGAPDNPSAANAASAMTCGIGAASAQGVRGRTSCKRQVSGSNPLTGSSVVFTFQWGLFSRLGDIPAFW